MRYEINTETKTIRILDDSLLIDVVEELKQTRGSEWRKYRFDTDDECTCIECVMDRFFEINPN